MIWFAFALLAICWLISAASTANQLIELRRQMLDILHDLTIADRNLRADIEKLRKP